MGRVTGLSQLKSDIQNIVEKGTDVDEIAAAIDNRFFDEIEGAEIEGDEKQINALKSLLYDSNGELISIFALVLRFFKMANRAICKAVHKLYGFLADKAGDGFMGILLKGLKILVNAVVTAGGAAIRVIGGVLSYVVAGAEYAVAHIWGVAVYIFNYVKDFVSKVRNKNTTTEDDYTKEGLEAAVEDVTVESGM